MAKLLVRFLWRSCEILWRSWFRLRVASRQGQPEGRAEGICRHLSAPPENRCAGNLRRTLGIRRDNPKIIQNLRPSNVFLDLQFYSVLYPLTELPNSTYGVPKNGLHAKLPMLILPTKIIPGLHHLPYVLDIPTFLPRMQCFRRTRMVSRSANASLETEFSTQPTASWDGPKIVFQFTCFKKSWIFSSC